MHKNIIILTGVHPNKVSGRAVTDLKNLLKDQGHKVCILSNNYIQDELEDVISVKSIFSVLKNRVRITIKGLYKKAILNNNYYMFGHNSYKQTSMVNLILKKIPFNPDVFIYIFPHNFLNEKDLYEINKSTGAPIYRYMADMAEMTGGCHYAWNCEGYTKSCGSCPGLYSYNPSDETYYNLKFKKKFIDKSEIYPVAGSEWQFQQLLKSTLYNSKHIYKILSPTNEKLFYPTNKLEVRKELKLPIEKKIIFFGSVNNSEKRKGSKELVEALVFLSKLIPQKDKKNIHLLVIGNKSSPKISELGFSISNLGFVNYKILAKCYQASDVFICSSIEDSGPTMINQSIMSGTPVVSFLMGVASELIINGNTGYIAELNNSFDLALGVKSILDLSHDDYIVYSKNCRTLALNLCSYEITAKKFTELISNGNLH